MLWARELQQPVVIGGVDKDGEVLSNGLAERHHVEYYVASHRETAEYTATADQPQVRLPEQTLTQHPTVSAP